MTKLRVEYACGKTPLTNFVDVADDEEYWLEEGVLQVGVRGEFEIMNEGLGPSRVTPPKIRLHIFNLAKVEVIP